jgi:hypothetical protein
MRRWFVALLMVCALPFGYGQKTRFGQGPPKAKPGADYPYAVHVHATHLRFEYDPSSSFLYLDVTLDGRNLELRGPYFSTFQISPGDFHARSLEKNGKPFDAIGQRFELEFPDNTVWQGTVTGVSE